MRQVPELSLLSYVEGSQADKVKFSDDLYRGLVDYGFIVLVDHIVDADLCQRAYEKIDTFFRLPLETKQLYIAKGSAGQRGYTAFGVEHAKDNPNPDLKEFWHVGRDLPEGHPFEAYYPPNVWPEEQIPGFTQTLKELYSRLDQTSAVILEALAQALDLDQNYFSPMLELGNSILRPIYYPPIPEGANANSIRAAAHEDVNLITILMGATASGLELLDRDGTWLPVQTREGQLVVDSGDMLSRMSNDVIPATTHRVVNPDNSREERFSMPFFVHPNPEATLSCIPTCKGDVEKYPPIRSHDFLMERLKDIGLM